MMPAEPRELELDITALGGLGDGIGHHDGQVVHVPFTLPGDRVRIRLEGAGKNMHATLIAVVSPGASRQAPPCRHFGICGGCRLQHLPPDDYRRMKEERVVAALRHACYGMETLQPLVAAGSGRRRVELAVGVEKGVVTLGYLEPRSRRLVDLEHCPSSVPLIEGSLSPLRLLLSRLKKRGCVKRVTLTVLDEGLDVLLACEPDLLPRDRELVAAEGERQGWTRLATETAGDTRTLFDHGATLRMGGMTVELPPAAFLQATEAGERALVERVIEGVGDAASIVDLYAGLGTYSLPLIAAGRRVDAYEGSEALTRALWNAARSAGREERLTATTRDLFRDPVAAERLRRCDAVIVNPPRNGAGPQVEQIARARPPIVMMVSCNPATFARDAARLKEAGYVLGDVTPIDQFRWTPHVELVARFVAG